jgi:hypothetical protein
MSKTTITNQTLHVNNDDNFDTISLDQEDSTSQYTIVPNALIRDKSISPQCRWLIIYLITNKPGWTIKSRQLWEHTKGFIGRDGIRKILNEAIEVGYIRRDIVFKSVNKGKLTGYAYCVSSTPKFKKCLREPDHQGPENQGTKELLSLRNISSFKVSEKPDAAEAAQEEIKPPPKAKKKKEDFSPQVHEVADKLLEIVVQDSPSYIPPKNMDSFLQEVHGMINIDKRSPEAIYAILRHTLPDPYYGPGLLNGNLSKKLRDKFVTLEKKMNAKPHKNYNEKDKRLREKDGTVVDQYKDLMF